MIFSAKLKIKTYLPMQSSWTSKTKNILRTFLAVSSHFSFSKENNHVLKNCTSTLSNSTQDRFPKKWLLVYLPKIRLTETLLLKKSQQKKKGELLNKCLKQLFVIGPNSLHTKGYAKWLQIIFKHSTDFYCILMQLKNDYSKTVLSFQSSES
jgi:hypothetical protein